VNTSPPAGHSVLEGVAGAAVLAALVARGAGKVAVVLYRAPVVGTRGGRLNKEGPEEARGAVVLSRPGAVGTLQHR